MSCHDFDDLNSCARVAVRWLCPDKIKSESLRTVVSSDLVLSLCVNRCAVYQMV